MLFVAVVASALVFPGVVALRALISGRRQTLLRKIILVASIDPKAMITIKGRQTANSTVAVPLRFRFTPRSRLRLMKSILRHL